MVARRASELSVQELLVGPGTLTFAATPGGPPFCGPAEAAHMQNVRVVVYGFFGLVSAGAITVAVSTRQMSGPSALRVIRLGATGLVLVVVAIGVGLGVAFDRLFTLLHQIVFPGGGWMFDPTTQRIVQLYPTLFWEFAAGTLAALSAAIGLVVIVVTDASAPKPGTRSGAHISLMADAPPLDRGRLDRRSAAASPDSSPVLPSPEQAVPRLTKPTGPVPARISAQALCMNPGSDVTAVTRPRRVN